MFMNFLITVFYFISLCCISLFIRLTVTHVGINEHLVDQQLLVEENDFIGTHYPTSHSELAIIPNMNRVRMYLDLMV